MKKTFRITVNDQTFDVVAELLDDGGAAAARPAAVQPILPASAPAVAAPVAAAPAPAAPAPKAAAPAGAGDVPSPLAGKVVSIEAPEGTAVKAGDQIMTLEAMKMNTVVSAPADGTVQKVHVQPGDGVDEGQALMTIA